MVTSPFLLKSTGTAHTHHANTDKQVCRSSQILEVKSHQYGTAWMTRWCYWMSLYEELIDNQINETGRWLETWYLSLRIHIKQFKIWWEYKTVKIAASISERKTCRKRYKPAMIRKHPRSCSALLFARNRSRFIVLLNWNRERSVPVAICIDTNAVVQQPNVETGQRIWTTKCAAVNGTERIFSFTTGSTSVVHYPSQLWMHPVRMVIRQWSSCRFFRPL